MEETGDWVEFNMACTIAGSVSENSDSSWVIIERVKTTFCGGIFQDLDTSVLLLDEIVVVVSVNLCPHLLALLLALSLSI